MELKELLGDAYKEGMTFEEISTALSDKNLADLSTGEYVRKDKATADTKKLTTEIADLKSQLKDRMSKEERDQAANDEILNELEMLRTQLKEKDIANNKSTLISRTADMRTKIGVTDDDKEFNNFVDLVAGEDATKNGTISSYLSKILKTAYDKGVADTTKSQIADNKFKSKDGKDGNGNEENLGTRLAKQVSTKSSEVDYFKR